MSINLQSLEIIAIITLEEIRPLAGNAKHLHLQEVNNNSISGSVTLKIST
jgi:hypothetical protein